mmetsp:Transcript_93662/g.166657  ORF Transcript_93662/g.166657 Transcript_93662/m.166657 type:complete len:574 (-) Transcript_93662:238-1959(-)|eukprot:CAMPEP_0197632040 /NCGR_PEP_ID=MMETSP1338-20131121/8982_1 /TAXON_ID=43686 ORGANISM="Pelagodinium beii, Strain RCC1491" /NCGR_SAMPLE_ID=MMETSP1338 /ASSEMBLY_ACC=CAM_ASM_000754 /LENGTH=573 /DNA_ID=CAMNT_0043203589 /DNA_START=44 /DNA_END=1765 /DNA_ORIENTATION=+
MGSGASAEVVDSAKQASVDDVTAALKTLSAEDLVKVKDAMAAAGEGKTADIKMKNIQHMTPEAGFDVIIVCTSTEAQARFWQDRLGATRGAIAPASCVICAVHEDWNSSGAGNGLGTLYAFEKAKAKAKTDFNVDLEQDLMNGTVSVGMYHTAGKGTRLAPIPGAENNNKPGVKLPGTVKAADKMLPLTILEAVIKQTGSYAQSRKGRLSVFWGDQVFVPSVEVSYDGSRYHADILACMGPMPTAEEWKAKGYSSYGLIAMGKSGEGAQVEKVDFDTATQLLSGLGELTSVGPSLGSFSVSSELLKCLLAEFAAELEKKEATLDSDPHFWMPLTLNKADYIKIMLTKEMTEEEASDHYDRIERMAAKLSTTKGKFGAVSVGQRSDVYWWDYGQVAFYMENNVILTADTEEAAAYRSFLGFGDDKLLGSALHETKTDAAAVALASKIKEGLVEASVLNGVTALSVEVKNSILMNVTAKKIKAEGALVYNVVDTSDEGIVLEKGDVLVGMELPSGDKIIMKSHIDVDGKKKWKTPVYDNSHSFEDIYKLNASADPAVIQASYTADHNAAAAAMGL